MFTWVSPCALYLGLDHDYEKPEAWCYWYVLVSVQDGAELSNRLLSIEEQL